MLLLKKDSFSVISFRLKARTVKLTLSVSFSFLPLSCLRARFYAFCFVIAGGILRNAGGTCAVVRAGRMRINRMYFADMILY